MADWTADATEALTLSLGQSTPIIYTILLNGGRGVVRSTQDKECLAEDESYENFNPSFTYPVRDAIFIPLCKTEAG